MNSASRLSPLWLLLLVAFAGCEIDPGKIDLWKTTENGPKKLAGALIDPDQPLEIRVKAAVALVEINSWDLFKESFQKMEKGDSQKVVAALAAALGEIAEGEGGGSAEATISKKQVDAKDGLYLLFDFAGPESRPAVERPLVAWCVEGSYALRETAGYNIAAIAKKVGAPAAQAMVALITADQPAIEKVARVIRDVGDPKALEMASQQMADQLRADVAKITRPQLIAAAVIGGDETAKALLELATTKDLDAELQRLSLRAYSQGIDSGYVKANRGQIDRLFAMAENADYDRYQREETYLTLAQVGEKADIPRVAKLLASEIFFYRLVGLRCLLRMDGEGQLAPALATKGLATDADEVDAVVVWVGKFPKLLPAVRALLGGADPFTRGVAVYVLGAKGDPAVDAAALEKLAADRTKLPKGFLHPTLGAAAAAALDGLKKKKG